LHVLTLDLHERQRAANACWEQILVENPTDAIALRFMNDCLFYLGRAREIKDVNLAVLPEWKKKGNYYHCYFRFLNHSFA